MKLRGRRDRAVVEQKNVGIACAGRRDYLGDGARAIYCVSAMQRLPRVLHGHEARGTRGAQRKRDTIAPRSVRVGLLAY